MQEKNDSVLYVSNTETSTLVLDDVTKKCEKIKGYVKVQKSFLEQLSQTLSETVYYECNYYENQLNPNY